MICWQWSCHRICLTGFDWWRSWSKYHWIIRIEEFVVYCHKWTRTINYIPGQTDKVLLLLLLTGDCASEDDDDDFFPNNNTQFSNRDRSYSVIAAIVDRVQPIDFIMIILWSSVPSSWQPFTWWIWESLLVMKTAVRFDINDFVSIVISLIR